MKSSDLVDGLIEGPGTPMHNPAPEEVASLFREATIALDRDAPEGSDVRGEPILIAPRIGSPVRLPNLIPDEWDPPLTEMIMRAVEQQSSR